MPSHITPQPVLQGARVELRLFSLDDAPAVEALAGAREVAAGTLTIPHPYGEGVAEEWIRSHAPGYAAGDLATFAVVELATSRLIGAVGLAIRSEHLRGELGYWVGVPFWGHGYATEAASIVLHFGFEQLGLHRIYAQHFARNPASGRVMQKLGMRHEGSLRQHLRKWDHWEDLEQYGILRAEWLAHYSQSRS